ncbi:MAG: hypothetical protein HY902_00695 [Deltaproteobacteria bacterium]|nr:hypothetical protein [Deltaproteobacteria bacterium]
MQSAADLARVASIDPARWAAVSAPTDDLQCDPTFLRQADGDGTGRVRVEQVLALAQWTLERLRNPERLAERTDRLQLADLQRDELGLQLLAVAERVLLHLDRTGQPSITLADVQAYRQAYVATLENGDGIVPPELVASPELAELARAVGACVGTRADVSGHAGIGIAELDRLATDGKAWLEWQAQLAGVLATFPAKLADPLAALQAHQALKAQLAAWFLACDAHRAAGLDAPRPMVLPERLAAALAQGSDLQGELTAAPLAAVHPSAELDLQGPLNAVWAAAVADWRRLALDPLLGDRHVRVSRADFEKIDALLQPLANWQAAQPPGQFAALGVAAVEELLVNPGLDELRQFAERDAAASLAIAMLGQLEKLVLCHRWVIELVNNFVNFSSIYDRGRTALLDIGSLVIDGRRLDFCIKVRDAKAHKEVANLGLLYLVYAAVYEREGTAPVLTLAAPVTSGERGRLRIGKRGMFIDNQGKQFDAVVIDLIEHPISIKEAALAPFRRAGQMISQRVEAWLGSQRDAQEKAAHAAAEKQALQTAEAAKDPAKVKDKDAAKPVDAKGKDGKEAPKSEGLNVNSLIIGGGMALAGVGALLASVLAALSTLRGWLGIAGIFAAVAGLSALLGWLKLRRRDMSLLLEANGWAVNLRMPVSRRIGLLFTRVPDLPKPHVYDRTDQLAWLTRDADARRRRRLTWLIVLLVVSVAGAVVMRFFGSP